MVLRPRCHAAHESRAGRGDGGFTLVELMIATLLATIVFVALAYGMAASLRTLAISKARVQGNQLATQGIEDLQRFSFNALGECAFPTGMSAPTNLSTIANPASGSCGGTPTYEEPCTPTVGSIPQAQYTCSRNGIAYTVYRFVAWGDAPSNTVKRMGVFVTWTDRVGSHQVAQQSSLRAPDPKATLGATPPQLSGPAAGCPPIAGNPSTCTLSGNPGTLSGTMGLSVSTTGLATTDQVFATLQTLTSVNGAWQPSTAQVPMTTTSASDPMTWTASLSGPANTFGQGSQFVLFTASRAADGKANSIITSPAINLCVSGSCSGATLPAVTSATVSPAVVSIDAAGANTTAFTISAQTSKVSNSDTVVAQFQTQNGFTQVGLTQSGCDAAGDSCTWTATVPAKVGYQFTIGQQPMYVTALQTYAPGTVDTGSTAAATTNTVTFQ